MATKYKKIEYINNGTSGTVHVGEDHLVKNKVAIKSIKLCYPRKDQYKRLYREISILKHLDSRYSLLLLDLYGVYDNGQLNEVCLILPCMDYDLRKVTQTYDLIYIQIIKITYQLLMGLNYLSDSGIIHRDLKPSNIGINENLDLKILDFGLARDKQDDLTDYVVTRWYRPLEVFCTSQYSMAVDMWSAGCILAELFTKTVLFKGKTQTDQSLCILKIMGFPSDEMLNKMNNKDTVLGLQLFKSYASSSNQLENCIRQKIENFVCSDEDGDMECANNVITMITQMLQLDPDERITPIKALNLPLFSKHKSFLSSYDEIGTAREFNCSSCQENDDDYWIEEIIKEINNFIPVN